MHFIPAIMSINPNLHIWVNCTTTDVAININIAKLLKYDGYNLHMVDSRCSNVVIFIELSWFTDKWFVINEHIIISERFVMPTVIIDTIAAVLRKMLMSLNRLLSIKTFSENIWKLTLYLLELSLDHGYVLHIIIFMRSIQFTFGKLLATEIHKISKSNIIGANITKKW